MNKKLIGVSVVSLCVILTYIGWQVSNANNKARMLGCISTGSNQNECETMQKGNN